jgi:hypothetical protein
MALGNPLISRVSHRLGSATPGGGLVVESAAISFDGLPILPPPTWASGQCGRL